MTSLFDRLTLSGFSARHPKTEMLGKFPFVEMVTTATRTVSKKTASHRATMACQPWLKKMHFVSDVLTNPDIATIGLRYADALRDAGCNARRNDEKTGSNHARTRQGSRVTSAMNELIPPV
jgi:hypothetical protein